MECVIYGAGIVGEILLNVLQSRGITVVCFCDDNPDKGSPLNGIPVMSIKDIAPTDLEFIISTAEIENAVNNLKELGYTKWAPGSIYLKDLLVERFPRFAVDACIACQESYLNTNKLFLRSVDVVITERCTLKCRDCSNLMQHYEHPINYERKEILAAVNRLCSIVDSIFELRLIGGEPFVNKEWAEITEELLSLKNISYITIYTNGTIVPKEAVIKRIISPKTVVIITDYGTLSRNLGKLEELLKKNDITFRTERAQNWTKCDTILPRNKTTTELCNTFRRCCAKNLYTLSRGRLYRCPFAANAVQIRPDLLVAEDSILLECAEKEDLREYTQDLEYLNICNFCSGRFLDDEKITPAIQE